MMLKSIINIIRKTEYFLSKAIKKWQLTAVYKSHLHPTSKLESGTTFYFSSIQKYSFCGYNCEIVNSDIGAFTSIANGVILGGGRHPMEWVGMSPVFYAGRDSVQKKFSEHIRDIPKRVSIGNDVWIGRSAIILPGVKIADGVVIGAGAVVTKSVPPYAIVAGNPAKLIRYRFDPITIERLLKVRWWDMSDADLDKFGPYFNDVGKFLATVEFNSTTMH